MHSLKVTEVLVISNEAIAFRPQWALIPVLAPSNVWVVNLLDYPKKAISFPRPDGRYRYFGL